MKKVALITVLCASLGISSANAGAAPAPSSSNNDGIIIGAVIVLVVGWILGTQKQRTGATRNANTSEF